MKASKSTARQQNAFPPQRRSACALAARRAELERLRRMTSYERVVLALTMGSILPGLASASPQRKEAHGKQP